jgi:5-formyltetrahydrofolate cyclo-ligase
MVVFAKDKATLRAEGSVVRDTITTARREAASAVIAERVATVAAAAHPRVIAAYMPIWSEVDTSAIVAWAFDREIAVVLPSVVDATTLAFRRYRSGDFLIAGRFGTRTPVTDAEIGDPDLVILPMIAFDRAGARLGYGGGFYDRAIARLRARSLRPLLIGIAFAAQEVPVVPTELHDIHMDVIVTENETLHFGVGRKR